MTRDPYTTPRQPLDLAAIAEYTAGVLYSRLAYQAEHTDPAVIDYARRNAASDKQRRYRARKKESKP